MGTRSFGLTGGDRPLELRTGGDSYHQGVRSVDDVRIRARAFGEQSCGQRQDAQSKHRKVASRPEEAVSCGFSPEVQVLCP